MNTNNNDVRVFIGIPLTTTVNNRLDKACKHFNQELEKVLEAEKDKNTDQLKLRWTDKKNRHVTLAFLGNLSQSIIEPLTKELRKQLADLQAFSLRIQEVDSFPDAKSPIIAALVALSPPIETLYHRVQHCCGSFDLATETRAYKPHITLARHKRRRQLFSAVHSQVLSSLTPGQITPTESDPQDDSQSPGLELVVKEVLIYQSRLSHTGSDYDILARVPLAAAD